MIIYTEADDSVHDLVKEALQKYHQELQPLNLRVGVVMALSVDKDGTEDGNPSLKNAGFPAGAKIKIVATKDRVYKNIDVEITIDLGMWNKLDEPKRMAIIDHELEHIDPACAAEVKTDDLGRPKIKMRLDDLYAWGFASIAERHKENSPEVRAFSTIYRDYGDILAADLKQATRNLDVLPPVRAKRAVAHR